MQAKPYPRYKPSGIEWLGDVPEHWDVKRGRFCQRVNPPSYHLRGLEPDDEVSFVPMEAVGEYGGLDLQRTVQLAEVGGGYTEFENGDVVVAKITPCFENGKGALALGLLNGVAFGTTELHVLRAFPNLERRFLFYLSISSTYRKTGEAEMYGAGGQKRVPPDFCKDFHTPLPPLPEQITIADYLERETGKIDALMAKKRELIEKLKEKRTALISRTVTRGLPPDAARAAGLDPNPKLKPTGIDWLGDVPEHWDVGKFSREVAIAEGQVDPEVEPYASMALIAPNHLESGTGRLLYLETSAEQGAMSGKYLCRKGDVIYSKIRPALAKVTIAPDDCLCSADMYPLRGRSRIANQYLYWLFLSQQFTAWSTLESDRVAMPKINRETLGEFRFSVPPRSEQISIASYLDGETKKLDGLTEKVQAAIECLQEYRTALITAAVTGKIDVRGMAA